MTCMRLWPKLAMMLESDRLVALILLNAIANTGMEYKNS